MTTAPVKYCPIFCFNAFNFPFPDIIDMNFTGSKFNPARTNCPSSVKCDICPNGAWIFRNCQLWIAIANRLPSKFRLVFADWLHCVFAWQSSSNSIKKFYRCVDRWAWQGQGKILQVQTKRLRHGKGLTCNGLTGILLEGDILCV